MPTPSSPTPATGAAAQRQPNILVILSDQQRFDTVNCYNNATYYPIVENLTPHLDRMAAQGTRFDKAFTCQPVCGPARSCMQTGLHAAANRCPTNACELPLDADTVAKRMNDAGYETAYVGKWHLASNRKTDLRFDTKPVPPERRGGYKDYWMASDILEYTSHGYEGYFFDNDGNKVDWEGYRVDVTANYVIDYLRSYATRRPDKPFFMFSSFIEPHHQNNLDRYVGPIGSKQRFARYNTPGDLLGTRPEPGRRADWPQHMPDYLGCCWSLDQNVGRIREELTNLSLDDNTIVLYISDHGCHFCTRNSEYKRSCHESSIRIPMIATGPGFTGGGVVDRMVSLIDLVPTILEAGGAEKPARLHGRPVQHALAGASDWPDDVLIQISESQLARAIRTSRWKYCVESNDPADWIDGHLGSKKYTEHALYDLEADPYEKTNLVTSAEHAKVRQELQGRLLRRMKEADEVTPQIVPAAA